MSPHSSAGGTHTPQGDSIPLAPLCPEARPLRERASELLRDKSIAACCEELEIPDDGW